MCVSLLEVPAFKFAPHRIFHIPEQWNFCMCQLPTSSGDNSGIVLETSCCNMSPSFTLMGFFWAVRQMTPKVT